MRAHSMWFEIFKLFKLNNFKYELEMAVSYRIREYIIFSQKHIQKNDDLVEIQNKKEMGEPIYLVRNEIMTR